MFASWQKYYWWLQNNKRDCVAMLNPYSALFTEVILPKLPSGRVIQSQSCGGYQVPRNDHIHPEDRIEQSYSKQLNLAFDKDEVKRLMTNPNLMVRFNKCLERGGLETPAAYILRLVDILKTLDSLESVEDEQKDKAIQALRAAIKQYKKH